MRVLVLAALACVGCQIHLHVDLPAEELAKLTRAQPPPAPPAKEPRTLVFTPSEPAHHAPCPLDEARQAFLEGDGVGALQSALRSNHEGWRVIAASACAAGDDDWVLRSIDHLTPGERERLRELCHRYGIELVSIYSAKPRLVHGDGTDSD
jgi:hypothetical protein